jgi:hypothetical protein
MPNVTRLVVGVLLGLAACRSVSEPAAAPPSLVLTTLIDNKRHYEGEPIYFVMELQNVGPDTAWVDMFSFASLNMSGDIEPEHGRHLDVWGGVVDYYYPPEWRGNPIEPGGRRYLIDYVQSRWGVYDSTLRDPYQSHAVPPGRYTFRVRFGWDVDRPNGLTGVVDAAPASFLVADRDAREDSLFRNLVALARSAWDSTTRPTYLASLLEQLRTLSRDDLTNPLLPLMATNLVVTADVLGMPLDKSERVWLRSMLTGIAAARPSSPAGAYAAIAACRYAGNASDTVASAAFRDSLAGRVQAALCRRGTGIRTGRLPITADHVSTAGTQ